MSRRLLVLLCALGLMLVACGDDDSDGANAPSESSTTTTAPGAEPGGGDEGDLPSVAGKRIGFLMAYGGAESNVALVDALEHGAQALGFDYEVVDLNSTPAIGQQAIDNFIQQKYDAIINVGITGEALQPSLSNARDAGIPVITIGIPASEETWPMWDAHYAPENREMGAVAAEYLAANFDPTTVMFQVFERSPGLVDWIEGTREGLDAAGFTIGTSANVIPTDITGTMGSTVRDLIQANPNGKIVIVCCDPAAPIVTSVAADLGRNDVTFVMPADVPSALGLLREGKNLVIASSNYVESAAIALENLANLFAFDTALPETVDSSTWEYAVIDADNIPAEGYYFDPITIVDRYIERWAETFQLTS